MSKEQERHHLQNKINDHETNIAQMQELLNRTPSEGLRTALAAETAARDAARARLFKLEEAITLENDIQQQQSLLSHHESTAQSLREERDAVQRRLTQAETELNRTRIELNRKQDELRQKEADLGPSTAPAPAAPEAAEAPPERPRAGGTMRLPQAPPAALRLANGTLEQVLTAEVTIGREKMQGIDIGLNESTVSGTHARLSYGDNQWTLTDLGSANGTWVNNTQIQPQEPTPIEHGTQLRFGRVSAMFELLT